eukprot:6197123-Pleurochrysis_carterae.AAC.2
MFRSLLLGPLRVEQHFYRLVDFHPQHVGYSGATVSSYWGWRLDRFAAKPGDLLAHPCACRINILFFSPLCSQLLLPVSSL